MLNTTFGILHLAGKPTRQIAIKITGVNTCTTEQVSIGRNNGLSTRKITLPSKLLGLVDQWVRFLLGIVGHVLSPIGDAGTIQSILGGFRPNTSQADIGLCLLAIQKDTRLSIGETKGFRREESRVATGSRSLNGSRVITRSHYILHQTSRLFVGRDFPELVETARCSRKTPVHEFGG